MQRTKNVASSCYELPIQSLVEITIGDLQVRALIHTGSTKPFISSHVYALLDFDSCKLKPDSINCVSITGNALNILCSFNAKFNTKSCFPAEFLVSDNISYDCILEWDFLVNNRFNLRGITLGNRWSYYLIGAHGETPIIADHVLRHTQPLSGVVRNAEPQLGHNQALFVESQLKAKTRVVLDEDISIPGRVEMLVVLVLE